MHNYRFYLHDGSGGLEDSRGVALAGRRQALAYAEDVVGELMRGREVETRGWCLDVYEDEDEKVFEILFASIDHTLGHLSPELRAMVEVGCERERSLAETLCDVNETVRETRALVAKSRGRPYLAAEHGVKTIRETEE